MVAKVAIVAGITPVLLLYNEKGPIVNRHRQSVEAIDCGFRYYHQDLLYYRRHMKSFLSSWVATRKLLGELLRIADLNTMDADI